jgi:peptidoglycan/LPS O-acetylase OafA/YrhL
MTNPSTPRFPGLDTLRAIAAIAVVATHTSFWAGVYGNGTLGTATQRLEVGVAVFFVLSGFLLSYPFMTQLRTGRPHDSTRRYLWKRSLRILPVYWVAVVAALLLVPANHALGASRWIDNLLLIDLYRNPTLPHALTQMWSLSTEVAFYLVLPLLMWLLTRYVARGRWAPARLLVTLGVLALLSLVWTAAAASGLRHIEGAHRALPSYFIWFAIGMALAVLDVDRRHRPTPSRHRLVETVMVLASSAGTCWLLALAVFTIASTPLAGTPQLVAISADESVVRTSLYAVVALLVVLPSVLGDTRSAYARTLAHPFLRHLGHISYSLFCCHVLVLELEARWLGFELFQTNPFVLFAVTLSISLVAAELLYRFVEKPFLRLKDARSSTAPETRQPIASTTSS